MRIIVLALFCSVLLVCGCAPVHVKKTTNRLVVSATKSQPVVDVPLEYRYRNPDGSCVHCAWCQLLEHNNMHEMATWWRKRYHGGEGAAGLRNKANAAGLKIADTTEHDVSFIEWACRTGRGCIVDDRPGHVRTLVGMDKNFVYINDNNGPPERIIQYDRNKWMRMWAGWAATPVYSPTPPTTH